MKKIAVSLIITFIINTVALGQSGALFEYKISSEKGNGNLKTYYAASGTRTEMNISIPQMPGGGFTRIMIIKNDTPGIMYTLDDKNKTFTSTHFNESETSATCENCVVKIIGKEKVGNYNCIHTTVTNGANTNDYWTTTEIAEFEKYSKTHTGNKYMNQNGDYGALVKNGAAGFVVKSIIKVTKGETSTIELVKQETKEFPASYFKLPEDYKAVSSGTSTAPAIDMNKIQNMTPEERQKYIEELKKQAMEKNGGQK